VPPAGAKVTGLAGDLDDLGGVREAEVVDGDGLDGTQLDAAVAAVAGAVGHGHAVPGQAGAAVQQRGLVGLDDEQVAGLLSGDQELGGLAVGLQGVCCDHHASKVQVAKQWLEGGDLAGGAVDLALGEHSAGGVVHRGQQVDLAAVGVAGAAQRLAIDRDCPAVPRGVVAVGQPGADRGGQGVGIKPAERAANGGLAGDAAAVRAIAAGAERDTDRLGSVGGPFGNRGHRAGAAQDCGGGHGQDGDEWVAAATGGSRVGDGGQIAEQVRWFGLLERVSIAQWVKARRDRG
jgi:hypothetical protein